MVAVSQLARADLGERLERAGGALTAGVQSGLNQVATTGLDPQVWLWAAVLTAAGAYVVHILRET